VENLAFVTRDEKLGKGQKTWYRFHTVTLCPIDRSLIDKKFMTGDQIAWLNRYHKRVLQELGPQLDKAHLAWLRKATRAI